MKNNPKIDFYKSDAVYTVLRRYHFSDEEKKVIHSAIVTAKKTNRDMSVIEKADVLLKHITTTRNPLTDTTEEQNAQKAARAQALYASSKGLSWAGKTERDTRLLVIFLTGMALLAVLAGYISQTYG